MDQRKGPKSTDSEGWYIDIAGMFTPIHPTQNAHASAGGHRMGRRDLSPIVST